MKPSGCKLEDVQGVYSGPEGRLWELIMGEQIHAGGFSSSMELAQRAGIQAGWKGVDLCSALGAGCRFLAGNFRYTAPSYRLDGMPVDMSARRTMRPGNCTAGARSSCSVCTVVVLRCRSRCRNPTRSSTRTSRR